jgi:hypothetical protein
VQRLIVSEPDPDSIRLVVMIQSDKICVLIESGKVPEIVLSLDSLANQGKIPVFFRVVTTRVGFNFRVRSET